MNFFTWRLGAAARATWPPRGEETVNVRLPAGVSKSTAPEQTKNTKK